MRALERQARAPMGFVPASTGTEGGMKSKSQGAGIDAGDGDAQPVGSVGVTNPDAINLDEMDE